MDHSTKRKRLRCPVVPSMNAVLPCTLCLAALLMCAGARAQPAVFARAAGGAAADEGAEVAVDRDGSSYVAGSVVGRAVFGGGTAQEQVFEDRCRSDGTVRSARPFGGPGARAAGVAADRDGGSYVVGSFTEPASFDDTTLTSAGGSDVFLAKFSGIEPLSVRHG